MTTIVTAKVHFHTCHFIEFSPSYSPLSDGTDEPGTSACPNGQFLCLPTNNYIPASLVDDMICGIILLYYVAHKLTLAFRLL